MMVQSTQTPINASIQIIQVLPTAVLQLIHSKILQIAVHQVPLQTLLIAAALLQMAQIASRQIQTVIKSHLVQSFLLKMTIKP